MVLLLSILVPTTGQAFDFSEAAYRRDARNILRLERLSSELRDNIRSFAAENAGQDVIDGTGHAWANEVVDRYSRIRSHLEPIRTAWEDAYSPRGARPDEAAHRLKGTALWLAATATLLDNAEALVDGFDKTVWAWRFNSPVLDSRGVLVASLFDDMHDALTRPRSQRAATQRILFLTRNLEQIHQTILEDHEGLLEDLLRIIAASSGIDHNHQRPLLAEVSHRLTRRIARLESWISRRILIRGHQFFNWAAGDFYAYEDPTKKTPSIDLGDEVYEVMASLVQPGDILIHKKGGTLVDRLIPGYYSHVALWTGGDEYLADRGIYDSARNRISQQQALRARPHILKDRAVLEAVFVGVVMNRLRTFAHCTSAAIIRLKPHAVPADTSYDDAISEVIQRGFYHYGQLYDFWFNVNSHNAIVCSELVYQAFPQSIVWPTTTMLGRPTISPDNVAALAGPTDEFPFEVVFFIDEQGSMSRGPEAWKAYWTALLAERCPLGSAGPEFDTLRRAIADLFD